MIVVELQGVGILPSLQVEEDEGDELEVLQLLVHHLPATDSVPCRITVLRAWTIRILK